ncbi:hypothetical protein [Halobacterium zhouii]|uniref:hypothetical protein n=1 Tax=Halobacterium zhouii TaxID=2902624 RepID=UPI001E54990D|nr:hypothetical protein [Halobacterium zhouii]
MTCSEDGCDRAVAIRLYDPRGPDRDVCLPHARVLAREDGVVAEPLTDSNSEWP